MFIGPDFNHRSSRKKTVRLLEKTSRRSPDGVNVKLLARDAVSGAVAALVTVSYCISFAALIFQNSIAGGFTLGLSALLTGTVVTGVIVALTTTLAPADAGPDTPAVAVMSVLAASIAAQAAAGGLSSELAVINVMIAITVSTALTGLLLFGLGALRLGVWLRFVPYPVIGGFLAASGWLLLTGGVEVMTGVAPSLSVDSITSLFAPDHVAQLVIGLVFAASVLVGRRQIDSFLVLPVAFFAFVLVLDTGLLGLGLAEDFGGRESWFLQGIGELHLWTPVTAIAEHGIDWMLLAQNAAEIGAVCGVTAVSMLLDVSSLEVARQKSADLDNELKTNGIANIVASVVGGVAGNLSLNGSVLINEAGAVSRASGVFAALVCGLVLLFGAEVATLIPVPLLGGLLAYLGFVILKEAFVQSPAQRSGTDMLLAGSIMAVIIYSGYLLGVVLGVIGACLLFAFSYSRIGVVRRHLTRAQFSSNVDRSPAEAKLLREHGGRIHVFWLSGFIFFGSSNRLFEEVRRCMDGQVNNEPAYLILDFSAVPGLDTSAVLSLVKLKNYCEERASVLIFSGLTEKMRHSFESAGFFGDESPHRVFPERNEALDWTEMALLAEYDLDAKFEDNFEEWIAGQLGEDVDIARLCTYLERHEFATGDVLLQQGEVADCVDLLASGEVAIVYRDDEGRETRLRRMSAQTVIGEMGFYRNAPRGAGVIASRPSVVSRLTRDAFDKMQKNDPQIASAFHQMIIRLLSDRLDFANREISALF